jgi:hypothetical protein
MSLLPVEFFNIQRLSELTVSVTVTPTGKMTGNLTGISTVKMSVTVIASSRLGLHYPQSS